MVSTFSSSVFLMKKQQQQQQRYALARVSFSPQLDHQNYIRIDAFVV